MGIAAYSVQEVCEATGIWQNGCPTCGQTCGKNAAPWSLARELQPSACDDTVTSRATELGSRGTTPNQGH